MAQDMAAPFNITLTKGAQADLNWFAAYVRRIIIDGIEIHLRYQPTVGSRKVIELRLNPVADWELRLGDYRILYDVDAVVQVVSVQAIGEKRGNRLLVQGQEFIEHESN
jgi:mRNA-degrading endonuclease RelE of RelBE toxin-antitoxin system